MPVARVVVVGGGIAGLAAAWELTGGAGGPGPDTPAVTLLEASARLGGALHGEPFGGRTVDLGPDGFLGRRPEALALCHELGLDEALVPVGGRGAGVWARGRIRPLPDHLALGIPTRFWPVARSGIVGLRGQLGLARDALLPRPDLRGPIGDRSVGPLVARKLGQRVVDRLVDPLIGGIHAGSVDDMSTAATFPPLLAAAQSRGSLMRALRPEVPAPDPEAPALFWAVRGGMSSLVERLAARLGARGAAVHCGHPVDALERRGGAWSVRCAGETIEADAVVVAVPAPAAGRLLRPHDEEVGGLLGGIDYASVTTVTLRVAEDAVANPMIGTGFLVPRRSPPAGGEAWAVTACTHLSQKWPHLRRPGEHLLRASVGRFGDDRADGWSDGEVIERVRGELGLLMGLEGEPSEARVTRWPLAFPQYRVHHLVRTTGIETGVARLGGVAVAGAAYRGVGVPACIASGRAAARAVWPAPAR
ncbi:MAG: protoporphyrinogen oxidase [Acidimicrobiales bacterium]